MRGGRRGRCWGGILGDRSYSPGNSGGRDGGGVGFFVAGPPFNNSTYRFSFVPLLIGRMNTGFLVFPLMCPLSSLAGEMDGKEREREEN